MASKETMIVDAALTELREAVGSAAQAHMSGYLNEQSVKQVVLLARESYGRNDTRRALELLALMGRAAQAQLGYLASKS